MMPDRDRAIAALAERKYGLFTTGQARGVGFTDDEIDNRCETGRWRRAGRGVEAVLAIAGAPTGWYQDLLAQVMAGGPCTVASHRAAAALWDLPGFEPGWVEVSKPRGRSQRIHGGRIHGSLFLPDRHVTERLGIPVTTPPRSLFDICSWVHPLRAERAWNNALTSGLTSSDKMAAVVAELGKRGRRGTTLARRLCEMAGVTRVASESELEVLVLQVLTAALLPMPDQQVNLGDALGWIGRVDFYFRGAKLIIEADGKRWHASPLDRRADEERDARLRAAGWTVIRVTWEELVNRPWEFIARVQAVLVAETR